MKSSPASLLARGQISADGLEALSALPDFALLDKMHTGTAQERACAARLLGRNPADKKTLREALLKQLPVEKALYVRLEICDLLTKFGPEAAEGLALLLGQIGTNQHRRVPDRVSAKKGFDLPRDLAARTLGRMPEALSLLRRIMSEGPRIQVLEALDAIGFLVFYNPHLAIPSDLDLLIGLAGANAHDDLLRWKCIHCLRAYNFRKRDLFLLQSAKKDPHVTIASEAEKILRLSSRD